MASVSFTSTYKSGSATADVVFTLNYSVEQASAATTVKVTSLVVKLASSGSGDYLKDAQNKRTMGLNVGYTVTVQNADGKTVLSKKVTAKGTTAINKTATVTKTHVAQSKAVTLSVKPGSQAAHVKTGSVSVPARPSYAVTYNANGGSGAPASQTKWYGESLKLQTGKPTRTNYQFLGWTTSAGATTPNGSYDPGDTYTGNAALALYAVWRQVYASPSLTIKRSYRCDSAGNAADEGSWAAVELAWSTFNANALDALSVTVNGEKAEMADMALTTASDGKSGTAKAVIDASMELNSSYAVSATMTDKGCTTSGVTGSAKTVTKADSISQAYYPFHLRAGGHGVGFGAPATEEGYMRIAHNIRQLDDSGNTALHATKAGNLTLKGSLSQSSDARLKRHIEELGDDACAFVRSLTPVLYSKYGEVEAGFYAQGVQEADPWGTSMVREGPGGYLTLEYTAIIAPLVAYCQSLERRISELEGKEGGMHGRD